MTDVVFKVYKVFYSKTPSKRRTALWVMIKWCIREYINTFKKEEIPVDVMTDEVINLDN
jgi:hypothetical protein